MGTTPAKNGSEPKVRTQTSGLSPDLLLAFHSALYNSFHLSGPPFPTFAQGTALQWVSCSLIFETRSEIPQKSLLLYFYSPFLPAGSPRCFYKSP